MLTITIQVNAPAGSAQGIKEVLGMFLEHYGDTKIIRIEETQPEQLSFNHR